MATYTVSGQMGDVVMQNVTVTARTAGHAGREVANMLRAQGGTGEAQMVVSSSRETADVFVAGDSWAQVTVLPRIKAPKEVPMRPRIETPEYKVVTQPWRPYDSPEESLEDYLYTTWLGTSTLPYDSEQVIGRVSRRLSRLCQVLNLSKEQLAFVLEITPDKIKVEGEDESP